MDSTTTAGAPGSRDEMPASHPGGLLYALTDPPADGEDEFNEWYDDEHVRLRLDVPGILNARRYVAGQGSPRYMACYDLTSPAVLEQPAYTRLRERRSERETAVMSRIPLLVRRIYRSLGEPRVSDEPVPRDAPFVLAVAMTPPEEKVDDFNAWYAEEHMPMLLKVPGWLRIRRFELLDGQGPRYLALHELANLDVFQIPDYKASISTPWRGRIHEYILEWERAIYELFRTFPRPYWEGSRS